MFKKAKITQNFTCLQTQLVRIQKHRLHDACFRFDVTRKLPVHCLRDEKKYEREEEEEEKKKRKSYIRFPVKQATICTYMHALIIMINPVIINDHVLLIVWRTLQRLMNSVTDVTLP